MSDVDGAKKLLADNGFVVLREKSYRQAQERQRIAECMRESAERDAESARHWAQTELCEETRFLRNRCEFLYGAAIKAGADPEDLRGRIYLDDHERGRSRLNPAATS
ncbi:MAG: hypothetical protein WBB07_17440 [Mycobacterium sp.]